MLRESAAVPKEMAARLQSPAERSLLPVERAVPESVAVTTETAVLSRYPEAQYKMPPVVITVLLSEEENMVPVALF